MVNLIDLFSSRLPIITLFEEKFKEKYQIEKFTGHWNETYYVYLFIMSLVHISLVIYTFYLLYTCLSEKKTVGGGTAYVNGFCDVLFACFCMPCYIVYRGFLNPCKKTTEVKETVKIVGIPTAPGYGQPAPPAPVYQPPAPAQPPSPAPPGQQGPVIMAQQPGATAPIMVPTTPVMKTTTRTKVGGKNNKKGLKLSNKVNI